MLLTRIYPSSPDNIVSSTSKNRGVYMNVTKEEAQQFYDHFVLLILEGRENDQ